MLKAVQDETVPGLDIPGVRLRFAQPGKYRADLVGDAAVQVLLSAIPLPMNRNKKTSQRADPQVTYACVLTMCCTCFGRKYLPAMRLAFLGNIIALSYEIQ